MSIIMRVVIRESSNKYRWPFLVSGRIEKSHSHVTLSIHCTPSTSILRYDACLEVYTSPQTCTLLGGLFFFRYRIFLEGVSFLFNKKWNPGTLFPSIYVSLVPRTNDDLVTNGRVRNVRFSSSIFTSMVVSSNPSVHSVWPPITT